jgi:cytochrome P450
VYAGSKRVNKYGPAVAAFAVPSATLATIDHDVHRLRRNILNPYFSKRAVTALEPMINDKVDSLCNRLAESTGPVDLDAAMAALTADIVSIYFYGKDFNYIATKDFKFVVRDAIIGLIGFYHFTRFVPTLANLIKSLPIPIVRMIQPGAAALLESQQEIKMDIQRSLNEKDNIRSKSVIVGALGDPDIPAAQKTLDRLVDEGTTVIFAGTETTARSISVAMFHLLHDKSLLQKLRDELSIVEKGPCGRWTCSQLETLPYLVSLPIIKGGL